MLIAIKGHTLNYVCDKRSHGCRCHCNIINWTSELYVIKYRNFFTKLRLTFTSIKFAKLVSWWTAAYIGSRNVATEGRHLFVTFCTVTVFITDYGLYRTPPIITAFINIWIVEYSFRNIVKYPLFSLTSFSCMKRGKFSESMKIHCSGKSTQSLQKYKMYFLRYTE